jgi:ribosomal protein S6--L-glutamate ligase
MRVAVLGIPGAWSTERLADALRAAGAVAEVVDPRGLTLRLPGDRLYHRGQPLPRFDGVVVKKIGDTAEGWIVPERINLLRHLEASGVCVLSAPARLALAVDRYAMTVDLAAAGLPVPETVVTEDVHEALSEVERLGVAVLKPLFTSKGRGMRRLEPGPALRPALESHVAEGFGPFYLQRFIEHPGRDLGVAVLNGAYLGAYWRIAGDAQWMTTIRAGGRYAPADPPAEAIDIAVRAARHFGLVFTGVDLIETPGGGFTVLEVSAFGGFRGLLDACGIDAAPRLAKVVLDHVARSAS